MFNEHASHHRCIRFSSTSIMPKLRAFCLVNNLIDAHTYDVLNTANPTTEQRIEVTHEEAEALIRNFNKDVPVLWNHGIDLVKDKPIGKIIQVYKHDNGLFALAEHNDDVISEVIEMGGINNVSMSHSRAGGVDNFRILEVSVCETGLRNGTGIISPEPVLCSQDQLNLEADTKMSEETPVVVDTPMYDEDGFSKFQQNVSTWQTTGVKPDDWDAEKDPTIYHYQINRYTDNKYLSDRDSVFLINQLGKLAEDELVREERKLQEQKEMYVQVASLVDSVARKHPSSNGVKITDSQKQEARRRLLQEAPLSAKLSEEQFNQLCEVRASQDAELELERTKEASIPKPSETMEPMQIDNDRGLELERIKLMQEQAKIEQLKLQAEIAKTEARQDKIKHNQKMEVAENIKHRLKNNNTRYMIPETQEEQEKPRPTKQQRSHAGRSLDPTKWGVDLQHPLWSKPRNTWAQPKPNVNMMRTLHEFAIDNGMPEAHLKWKPNEIHHGSSVVSCSADFQEYIKSNGSDNPLDHCLNLACMIGGRGASDPTRRLSHPQFRVRRMQRDDALQAVQQFGWD